MNSGPFNHRMWFIFAINVGNHIFYFIFFFFVRFISANMRPKSDKTALIEQNLCCSHTPCIDFSS